MVCVWPSSLMVECLLPNARLQLLPEAGAQRTLEAVSCTPLFGAGSDTDSRIPINPAEGGRVAHPSQIPLLPPGFSMWLFAIIEASAKSCHTKPKCAFAYFDCLYGLT